MKKTYKTANVIGTAIAIIFAVLFAIGISSLVVSILGPDATTQFIGDAKTFIVLAIVMVAGIIVWACADIFFRACCITFQKWIMKKMGC